MSNFCNTELCASIESKVATIDNSATATDLMLSSYLVNTCTSERNALVNAYGSLPDANTVENGHVAYIGDGNVPVIASNGVWIGLDGRVASTRFEGELWGWGNGFSGSLGDGFFYSSWCSPVREFCSATDWCQVAGSSCHGLGIKTSGELWAWGNNNCGQVGDGTQTCRCSPVREFCSATDWCQVSSGGLSSAGVKTTGQIWTWGANTCAMLGNGTLYAPSSSTSPIREFCSDTNWCQVSNGLQTNVAIKTSGELWAWGSNAQYQLGDGTAASRCSPVREICSATDWCRASAGQYNAGGIKTDGSLWIWGNNGYAQIGDGFRSDRCSPVREICCATNWCEINAHILGVGLKTDGTIWSWGLNCCGNMALGNPVNDPQVYVCSPVQEYCSATDWCYVNHGGGAGAHVAAIKTTGSLWSWGSNGSRQLGDGTSVAKSTPVREISFDSNWCTVSAGFAKTMAIKQLEKVCR